MLWNGLSVGKAWAGLNDPTKVMRRRCGYAIFR